MSTRNFQFTDKEAQAIFLSSSLTNVMDAFLQHKFGKEYIDFRMSTIERWIENHKKMHNVYKDEISKSENHKKRHNVSKEEISKSENNNEV